MNFKRVLIFMTEESTYTKISIILIPRHTVTPTVKITRGLYQLNYVPFTYTDQVLYLKHSTVVVSCMSGGLKSIMHTRNNITFPYF